jgi:Cu(I)/Ag(I) efflux system membrane fusion protein
VEPMKDLYEIADLSKVWIQAEVYEDEVNAIAEGAEATVHLAALPGEYLRARVTFISPTLDELTRTARIRLEVPNPEGKLRPGMYGTVALPVPLGEAIAVDDQAVLDSGTRQIVFVETAEGEYEPREVTLGPRADGQVVVRSGIEVGERIVTSGNFFVDSESRLKAALLGGTVGTEASGKDASGDKATGHAH